MPAAAFPLSGMRRGRKPSALYGAPDQRCPLSRKRTYQRISIPITLALAGALLVLAPPPRPMLALASTTTSNAARITGTGRSDPAPPTAVTLAAIAAPRAAAAPPARPDQPPPRTPRQIAKAMLAHRFGWKAWQFKYLNRLWAIESGWNRPTRIRALTASRRRFRAARCPPRDRAGNGTHAPRSAGACGTSRPGTGPRTGPGGNCTPT